DETLDLFGELRRRSVAERADAVDEESFTPGKGRRQRIIDSGRFDAPAVPKSRRGRGAAEAAIARRDAELRRSRVGNRVHGGKDRLTYICVNKRETTEPGSEPFGRAGRSAPAAP